MIIKGWMPKGEYERFKDFPLVGSTDEYGIPQLFRTKGKKSEWTKEGWPPVKVEVEIREV